MLLNILTLYLRSQSAWCRQLRSALTLGVAEIDEFMHCFALVRLSTERISRPLTDSSFLLNLSKIWIPCENSLSAKFDFENSCSEYRRKYLMLNKDSTLTLQTVLKRFPTDPVTAIFCIKLSWCRCLIWWTCHSSHDNVSNMQRDNASQKRWSNFYLISEFLSITLTT